MADRASPAASDCEFAVWNFTVGFCMNAADALSLLRAQAAENANGATANLATLNNGAASLFAKVPCWLAGFDA